MTTDRSISGPLRRLCSTEEPAHALSLAVQGIVTRVRDRFQSWVFRAPGLHLGPGCIVRGSKFIEFGSDVYAHGHLWVEAVASYRDQQFHPRIRIADRVSFSEGVHITCIDRISVASDVLFGSHVYVSDHNHGSYKGSLQSHPDEPPSRRQLGGGGPVEIEECVWIGDNAVIVGPVTIGRGAIIAANSVVRANVPRYTMVGGIPAKPLRRYNESTSQWEKTSSP